MAYNSIYLISLMIISAISSQSLASDNIKMSKIANKEKIMTISQEHKDYVEREYKTHKKYYRDKYKESILQKIIVKGMWPTEAFLAGGGGTYRVKADKNVWSESSNPISVMQMQSIKPDESEIIIQFCNKSQFSSENDIVFEVIFKMGIAENINIKQ